MLKLRNLVLIFIFTGCNMSFSDDELSLQRRPYSENTLKINGYYYDEFYTSNKEFLLNIYFFYSNGIVRSGVSSFSSFKEVEDCILNHQMMDGKSVWGVFHIHGNNIKFECWYPSSGLGDGLPAYVSEGTILNDSTFHITLSYRSNGEEREKRDELYHFRKFSPKPDSITQFIP